MDDSRWMIENLTDEDKKRIWNEYENKIIYEMQAAHLEWVERDKKAALALQEKLNKENEEKLAFAIKYYQFRKQLSFWGKLKELFK